MVGVVALDPGDVGSYLSGLWARNERREVRDLIVRLKANPRLVLVCVSISNPDAGEASSELVDFIRERIGSRVVFLDKVIPQIESECEKLWGEVHDMYSGNVLYKCASEDFWGATQVDLDEVDLVIAVGGDGTILKINKIFQDKIPPVIGLSMGSLGYMSKFCMQQVKDTLENVATNGLNVSLRSLLYIEIFNEHGHIVTERTALNECVIDRGLSPFITTLDVYYGGTYFTTVSGDGLLLGTPTGSTAYSMSAGGPIVHPNIDAMLFTFICPHSISYRPLILPLTAVLEVHVPHDNRGYVRVCIDGNYSCNIKHGCCIRISKAHSAFPLVLPNDVAQETEFCRAIKENLHWNVRVRQHKVVLPKPEQPSQQEEEDNNSSNFH